MALPLAAYSDPIDQWAYGAIHAWDFLANRARFNYTRVGVAINAPSTAITRATTGYAQRLDGQWVNFASGAARITDRGYLFEGARTNILLWSRDLTNAAWVKVNTSAALTQTGIFGDANSASLITATSGLGTILQTVVSGSASRTASVSIKRSVGSGTIEMTQDGATYTDITAQINTTSFTRVTLAVATITNPIVGFRITTNTDAIIVDCCQLESTTGSSSPIVTTTASATRNADTCAVTSGLVQAPMTLYAEFELAVNTAGNQGFLAVNDATSNNQCLIGVSSGPKTRTVIATASVNQATVVDTSNISLGVVTRIAGACDANDCRSYRGGASIGTPDVAVTLPTGLTNITIGGLGASEAGAYLRRLAIWTRAFTNNEMARITT